MSRTALIAGATGLVGSQLLDLLLNDPYYEKVIVLTRRLVSKKSDKLVNLLIAFENLDAHAEQLKADDVYCCLGTTMKKAGSKDKFRQVDFAYPYEIARLFHTNGAQQFLLISALGADSNSSIFYNRVKGDVEEAITSMGFRSYHIFRPSLLMGPRQEKRLGEGLGKAFFKVFGFLFAGPLKKYKAIDSAKVAKAMFAIARQNKIGKFVHESRELQKY
ncbi:NAD-dependent epimerase/dehydratase family protein [Fulvivirga kasyanovii]|uniref:NAD-dependent epimerase/dehydratase family protein n=1 Tax=Fulvivirga kasyanovii TaxID=396812 RepID=A0ABW9RX81_9BACT|nr:NAD-dependent epimerase/dehydratase family protein [Fulvivirga kasyanovii]MTI28636.1 NAD-dependent epimerase/dehydratase family protein [Fulvivirga kasyanovii]